jgi:hypothetical protein
METVCVIVTGGDATMGFITVAPHQVNYRGSFQRRKNKNGGRNEEEEHESSLPAPGVSMPWLWVIYSFVTGGRRTWGRRRTWKFVPSIFTLNRVEIRNIRCI